MLSSFNLLVSCFCLAMTVIMKFSLFFTLFSSAMGTIFGPGMGLNLNPFQQQFQQQPIPTTRRPMSVFGTQNPSFGTLHRPQMSSPFAPAQQLQSPLLQRPGANFNSNFGNPIGTSGMMPPQPMLSLGHNQMRQPQDTMTPQRAFPQWNPIQRQKHVQDNTPFIRMSSSPLSGQSARSSSHQFNPERKKRTIPSFPSIPSMPNNLMSFRSPFANSLEMQTQYVIVPANYLINLQLNQLNNSKVPPMINYY